MARIEVHRTGLETLITIAVGEHFGHDAIAEAIQLAKSELAKRFWDENADKIMAQMDLKGLAALIAVEASKALEK